MTRRSMFSDLEIEKKLLELKIDKFEKLIDSKVYYAKKTYGVHKVISWDEEKFEYLLELEGQKFNASPFTVYLLTHSI